MLIFQNKHLFNGIQRNYIPGLAIKADSLADYNNLVILWMISDDDVVIQHFGHL
ncbi:hypothetical protein D3C72_2512610 [compost metagenome]